MQQILVVEDESVIRTALRRLATGAMTLLLVCGIVW